MYGYHPQAFQRSRKWNASVPSQILHGKLWLFFSSCYLLSFCAYRKFPVLLLFLIRIQARIMPQRCNRHDFLFKVCICIQAKSMPQGTLRYNIFYNSDHFLHNHIRIQFDSLVHDKPFDQTAHVNIQPETGVVGKGYMKDCL